MFMAVFLLRLTCSLVFLHPVNWYQVSEYYLELGAGC